MFIKKILPTLGVLFVLLVLAIPSTVFAEGQAESGAEQAPTYPQRPITIVSPYAAGGGTTSTARMLGAAMQGVLGVPVNVVSREGGGGLIGHEAVAEAEPDGYTIGVMTSVIGKFHWTDQSDLTWRDFTPLVQYNFDPGCVAVKADSPFETLEDLISWAEDNEGYQVSGASRYGAWHQGYLKLYLALDMDVDSFTFIPTRGAAPALNELAAGGVDVALASLPEARGLIEAGKIRALAVFSDRRDPNFPDIPTAEEAMGVEVIEGAWRGIGGPAGMPPEVVDTLLNALEEAYNSDEFQSSMKQAGFGLEWKDQEEYKQFLQGVDDWHGEMLKAVGEIE